METKNCNDCIYNDNCICDKFGVPVDDEDCCEDVKKILKYHLTYGTRYVKINEK